MKQKKLGLIAKIVIPIALVIAIFVGGIISLDKVIIPKQIGQYNINNIGDLVSVISSFYGVKKEYKTAKAEYSEEDNSSALSKLQSAGYLFENDWTISNENADSFKGNEKLTLSEKEIASMLIILQNNCDVKKEYPTIGYIGAQNIEILDLKISIADENLDKETNLSNIANVNLRLKINTEKLKKQIATQMETTEALLNLIVPSNLYFEVNFDLDVLQNTAKVNQILVNGQKPSKGDKLINLLVEFIYNDSDEMTYEKFASSFAEIVTSSIKALGDFKFVRISNDPAQNGIEIN